MTDQQAAPSESTPKRSRAPMQLVGERQAPDPSLSTMAGMTTATATTPPKPQPVSRETAEHLNRAAWRAGMLGAVNLLIVVVAVRLILLVAVVGAIILAYIVIESPDPWRLGALGIYALVVVVPTVWLSSRG
jgi:hypothetical protein